MHLVLALGALSLSATKAFDAQKYYTIALNHKHRSLQLVQRNLQSASGAVSDHNLIAIMMLCVLDVSAQYVKEQTERY